MQNFTELKTPIKEIIFSISFNNDKLDEKNISTFTEDAVITHNFHKQRGYKAELKSENQNPPITSVYPDGFILTNKAENKLLKVKLGSFSFHKIKEYEKFDSLFSDLKIYWGTFLKHAVNSKITSVSLRYLNFIEAPEKSKLSDWVTITSDNPFTNELLGEFVQIKFNDQYDPLLAVTIVAAKGKDPNGKSGIILDIILSKENPIADNSHDLEIAFNEMRSIKNKIFEKSITTKTKNNYQQ
jgi:uncharacterized protein (TIGR04255 family)